jgi:hypothetical protein
MASTLNTGNYLIPVGSKSKRNDDISVPIITVDSYIASRGIQRVDGIKGDIEGAELYMLRGAPGCIRRDHPWLLLEIEEVWTNRQGYSPKDIFEFLFHYDYSGYVISRVRGNLHPVTDVDKACNEGSNFLFINNIHAQPEILSIVDVFSKNRWR